MRIYEIQSNSLGPEIDNQLQGVAQGINANNNAPQTPQQPPPAPSMDDEEQKEEQPKKVDPYLIAAVKGMPYVNDYEFDEQNKIAPYNLLQRTYGELLKVRNLVRAKINMRTMTDQYGLYDDPAMKFYTDLITFVERVMDLKKQHGQDGSPSHLARQERPNNPAANSNVRHRPSAA